MSAPVMIAVTTGVIALSAFFVIIEFALIGARRHRLEASAATSSSARAALRGMNELTLMLAGAQLGITACTFALGAITKPYIDGWLGPTFSSWGAPEWLAGASAFGLSMFIVTFLHLVIGEMAPKSWAIAHPELAAKIIGLSSRAYIWPFRPFLVAINHMANRLVARSGVEPVERAAVGGRDADTIRHLVEHSTQVGVLEPELRMEITKAIELQAMTIDGMLDGKAAPTSVAADATVADVQAVSRESGHLRILLTGAGGSTSSVVHVRDTLLTDPASAAAPLARPAFRVEGSTPVHEVLRQMRERRVQLAVIERDGAMLGVVTLSDVVNRVLPESA